jgi:hypothetical protein
MTADDVHDILDKIPAEDQSKTVLWLRYGAGITIDAVARREEEYLVLRGRENGTSDEGRAFFVPYADILYIKIDRLLKIEDLKRMYGEKVAVTVSKLDADTPIEEKAADDTPAPVAAMDPAAIAKQNLLARIRAAKTAAGAKG